MNKGARASLMIGIVGILLGLAIYLPGVVRFGSSGLENPVPVECGACEGGVTELMLLYSGLESAHIQVIQKYRGTVLFEGDVEPGESFSFQGEKEDGTMGPEVQVFVNQDLHTLIDTTCSWPIGPGLLSGDVEVVRGSSLEGGELCPVTDCGECEGKVTELTLVYLGEEPVQVRVVQKNDEQVVFDDEVVPHVPFRFNGLDHKGTLTSKILIYVEGDLFTYIHTSCSTPIGPGLVSGDFMVMDGQSRAGRLLCPLYDCGNGSIEEPEECGEPGLGQCPDDRPLCEDCLCKPDDVEPECGNGVLEGDEECEEGVACPSEKPFCIQCRCYLPIDLAYLKAVGLDGNVKIEWATDSETKNLGFYLLRSTEEQGEYTRLNQQMVPAEGSPTSGFLYEYVDENVENGTTYWYELEDVDVYEESTFHGPASAIPGEDMGWQPASAEASPGGIRPASAPFNYLLELVVLPLLFVGLVLRMRKKGLRVFHK